MGEKFKKIQEPLVNFWNKLSKVVKIVLVSSIAAVLVISAAVAVLVNNNNASYTVLFPGMTRQESMEVFAALQSRNIPVRRTQEGEVSVPENKIGEAMLEMAVLGYPKTTMPFDTFSSNAGFTTTEFEKKQYLLFNLQERMERTISAMSGVKNVTVTITVPENTNYAWNENKGVSTASITLTMLPGSVMSPEKVSGLKQLMADSVPQLSSENVTVVNGDTMEEMKEESDLKDKYGLDRLGFETEIERKIESKIKKVLSLGYGPNDVMVSATVVIDYDKMITENLQYIPESDGKGVESVIDEKYSAEGSDTAQGIPGEELNTDVPIYEANPTDGNGYSDYQRKIDYLVSQMKSQVEKDYAKLKYATVAITVKDNELTEEKQTALIETASKAANIPIENISLNNFLVSVDSAPASNIPSWLKSPFFWGGMILLLALLAFAAVMVIKMSKKKKPQAAAEGVPQGETTEGEVKEVMDISAQQKEMEDYRSSLLAKAGVDSKDSIVTEEMKKFARENPEITAAMIRNWLREGEEE